MAQIGSQVIIDRIIETTSTSVPLTLDVDIPSQNTTLVILVEIATTGGAGNTINAPTIDLNGTNIPAVGTASSGSGGNQIARSSIFVIRNAPVGTQPLTLNASITGTAVTFNAHVQAINLLGASFVTPNYRFATAIGSQTSISAVLTPDNTGSIIFEALAVAPLSSPSLTPTAGQTMLFSNNISGGAAVTFNGTNSPSTYSWNVGGTAGFNGVAYCVIAISPAQAPSIWYPNTDFRNGSDIINASGLDQGPTTPNNGAYGYYPSTFYQNSFLHTVGKIINPVQPTPAGGGQITSQVIIDNITQSNTTAGGTDTITFDHRVSSQDAVIVVTVVGNNNGVINSVTYNGTSLILIGSATNAGAVNAFYWLPNPPVGNFTLSVNGGTTGLTVTALSLLGVNKKITQPLFVSSTGTSATPLVNVQVASANSLILDTIFTAGQQPTTPFNPQTMYYNTVAANNLRAAGSYMYANPGVQAMQWNVSSANYNYTAIVLEPAQAPSMWFPVVRDRNSLDVINANGLNTNAQIPAVFSNPYGYAPSQFYKNSFLHTVGRVLPPPATVVNAPASTGFNTSQIVIDRISQIAIVSGNTINIDHYVSSQDAVMVIFASQMGVAQGINSVTLNGQSLSNLATNSVTTVAGGVFYAVNPNVGINTITSNITLAAAMQLVVISLLGVDKKSTIPITVSNNGVASTPSTTITPASANSLLIDFVGTLSGSGTPDMSQVQYFEQPQGGSSAFGSIKLASNSQQTMSWSTAGLAWTQFIIALEPANALSMWYPGIDLRTILDVITPNGMDASINPSGNFLQTNGNYPSTFWQNSFLHTVGRSIPQGIQQRLSTTLLLMGLG